MVSREGRFFPWGEPRSRLMLFEKESWGHEDASFSHQEAGAAKHCPPRTRREAPSGARRKAINGRPSSVQKTRPQRAEKVPAPRTASRLTPGRERRDPSKRALRSLGGRLSPPKRRFLEGGPIEKDDAFKGGGEVILEGR